MLGDFSNTGGYEDFLRDLKERIRSAQVRAALAINQELIVLYWQLGRSILTQQQQGWGAKVIARLAKDLRQEFPEMKGFSSRNLLYMRTFADSYPDEQIVQQLVAQIPWGHNVRILDQLKDQKERLWYVRKTIEQGWSRAALVHQMESGLYRRMGGAVTNFDQTLPLVSRLHLHPSRHDLVAAIGIALQPVLGQLQHTSYACQRIRSNPVAIVSTPKMV